MQYSQCLVPVWGEISETFIYRAASGGVEKEVSLSGICSHPRRLQRKIQSGLLLAKILRDLVRSADYGERLHHNPKHTRNAHWRCSAW